MIICQRELKKDEPAKVQELTEDSNNSKLGYEDLLRIHQKKLKDGYKRIFIRKTRWASGKIEYESSGEAIRYRFMIINSPESNNLKEEVIISRLKPIKIEKDSVAINETLDCRLIIADSEKERNIGKIVPGSRMYDDNLNHYNNIQSLREYAEKYIAARKKKLLSRANLQERPEHILENYC